MPPQGSESARKPRCDQENLPTQVLYTWPNPPWKPAGKMRRSEQFVEAQKEAGCGPAQMTSRDDLWDADNRAGRMTPFSLADAEWLIEQLKVHMILTERSRLLLTRRQRDVVGIATCKANEAVRGRELEPGEFQEVVFGSLRNLLGFPIRQNS